MSWQELKKEVNEENERYEAGVASEYVAPCPCCAGTMNGMLEPVSEYERECNECGYVQSA